MDAKTVLTDFSAEMPPRPEVARLLAEAGLELWQAPEGFWAVRLKPGAPLPATQPRRRPGRRAR